MADRGTERTVLRGTGASFGIGMGRAFFFSEREIPVPHHAVEDTEAEKGLFFKAQKAVLKETAELFERTLNAAGKEAAEIFDLHASLLSDPEFINPVLDRISAYRVNAAFAVEEALDELAKTFRAMDDAYMRERSSDILDIKACLLAKLLDRDGAAPNPGVKESCVIVAEDLSPTDTAKLDLRCVAGIVTARGGLTSHAAILARTLSIPAVICMGGDIGRIPQGAEILVDGETGRVVIHPTASDSREFVESRREREEKNRRLLSYRDLPTETGDGHRLLLMANIGTPDEVDRVLENGAEGIGLFRSEFLFLNRNEEPSENEQYEAYRKVLMAMGDKPVIVRTLDIGGDKEVPFLDLPREDNPFLGNRAIRLCLSRQDLFLTQLKALLRAGVFGNLHIMLPMIISLDELRESKGLIERAKAELRKARVPHLKDVKVGIMIETPAAALMAGVLAGECDFFSIGTNDLTQYTLAVDRGNRHIADLYTPHHPAVLSLIRTVASVASARGIPCGICGEAAADKDLVPLFVGYGIHELSMVPGSILETRRDISGMTRKEIEDLVFRISVLETADGVRTDLRQSRERRRN